MSQEQPPKQVSERPKQEKKPKSDKKNAAAEAESASGPLELSPEPAYFQHRIEIFERLKKEYDEEIAKKERTPITIALPDGKTHAGKAWETTPGDVARSISKSLYENTVVAEVDGVSWTNLPDRSHRARIHHLPHVDWHRYTYAPSSADRLHQE